MRSLKAVIITHTLYSDNYVKTNKVRLHMIAKKTFKK